MSEDKITTCYKHKKVETNLRCASCGKPICTKCVVQTPVGGKCRQCASLNGAAAFDLTFVQSLLAILAGLVFGAIAGWGVEFFGIFMIFIALAYGGFAGEMIMRAAGRRRGIKLEIIAGFSMAIGALIARLAVAGIILAASGAIHPPYGVFSIIYDLFYPTPIPAISLIAAIASAVSRIRYI